MSVSRPNAKKHRLLVVIANFGKKNHEFLKKAIRRYQNMPMEVDIVVVSEALKSLGDGVKVIVGLPSRNPWSLPFAHKQVFKENVDRYELFAYSEDDMLITEENIKAFLRITPELANDEIAGFLRYEVDESGIVSLPEVHGSYHWKTKTVRRRGSYSVAEFSNEHAAFYILTRDQLKRAIKSGGFIRNPYEGRYDMLISAATDPYTCCGFRKIICISSLTDFLIHHMPNHHSGPDGLPLVLFEDQIQILMDILKGAHSVSSLCDVEPKVLQRNWYKSYYEKPCEELLRSMPDDAKTILSVGCGWGATEVELMRRGSKVTALPLDSVIGAVAACRGIEVVYGKLEEGIRSVKDRKFDCVLITRLLHFLPDPWYVLAGLAQLVSNTGTLVVVSPNFEFLTHLIKRVFGVGDYAKLRDFDQSGIHTYNTRTMRREIESLGFRVTSFLWLNLAQRSKALMLNHWPKRFVARDIIISASRMDK